MQLQSILNSVKISVFPMPFSVRVFGRYYSIRNFDRLAAIQVIDFIKENLNLNTKIYQVSTLSHLLGTETNTKKFMFLASLIKNDTQKAFNLVNHGNDEFELVYNSAFDIDSYSQSISVQKLPNAVMNRVKKVEKTKTEIQPIEQVENFIPQIEINEQVSGSTIPEEETVPEINVAETHSEVEAILESKSDTPKKVNTAKKKSKN